MVAALSLNVFFLLDLCVYCITILAKMRLITILIIMIEQSFAFYTTMLIIHDAYFIIIIYC